MNEGSVQGRVCEYVAGPTFLHTTKFFVLQCGVGRFLLLSIVVGKVYDDFLPLHCSFVCAKWGAIKLSGMDLPKYFHFHFLRLTFFRFL